MKRKAFFLVLAVFLLGVAMGAVGFYVANERIQANDSRHVKRTKQSMVERLNIEIGLTPEQQQRVAAILEETRRKFDATYAPIRPQIEAIRPQLETIRQEGRQNIRGLLTPEQLAKFESYLQRIDQERAEREQERSKTNAK